MDTLDPSPDKKRLTEEVRDACLRAATDAYEDALIRGLCAEGAWECAVGAIESLDLKTVIREMDSKDSTTGAQS